MLQIFVTEEMNGRTVGEVLRRSGVSVTAVRKAKHVAGGITADGQPVYTNATVYTGQTLCVASPEHVTTLTPQQIPLNIVFENADAVVLEKPAGIAVHPTLNYPDGTLGNAWLGELERRAAADKETRNQSGSAYGFFPVYRLDKDTSGLLLCGQNGAVLPFLSRSCSKVYAAIVEGRLLAEQGCCTQPIGRMPGSVILRRVDEQGQPAQTRWQLIANGFVGDKTYSLITCRLLTGRTHQIRVHMSWLGYPLAGDDLYGGQKSEAFPRQALHCAGLVFCGPDKKEVRLFSPFPGEMLKAAGIDPDGANRKLQEAFGQITP